MVPETTLNVTIVGAGIGGLFAARVLREKHNVTVLERSSGVNEVGAALSPGPNATQFLYKYGWDAKRAGAMDVENVVSRNAADEVIVSKDVTQLAKIAGSPWKAIHRVDLVNELHRLATAPSSDLGISGSPAKVYWRTIVNDVDVQSGDVTLEDGTVIHSDLVVGKSTTPSHLVDNPWKHLTHQPTGADGIRSVVRPHITGEPCVPRPTGTSMFRFVMPREMVESTKWAFLIHDRSITRYSHVSEEGDRAIWAYPCRNHQLLNVACMAPDSMINLPTKASWVSPGEVQDLLRVFHDFKIAPLLA